MLTCFPILFTSSKMRGGWGNVKIEAKKGGREERKNGIDSEYKDCERKTKHWRVGTEEL